MKRKLVVYPRIIGASSAGFWGKNAGCWLIGGKLGWGFGKLGLGKLVWGTLGWGKLGWGKLGCGKLGWGRLGWGNDGCGVLGRPLLKIINSMKSGKNSKWKE